MKMLLTLLAGLWLATAAQAQVDPNDAPPPPPVMTLTATSASVPLPDWDVPLERGLTADQIVTRLEIDSLEYNGKSEGHDGWTVQLAVGDSSWFLLSLFLDERGLLEFIVTPSQADLFTDWFAGIKRALPANADTVAMAPDATCDRYWIRMTPALQITECRTHDDKTREAMVLYRFRFMDVKQ